MRAGAGTGADGGHGRRRGRGQRARAPGPGAGSCAVRLRPAPRGGRAPPHPAPGPHHCAKRPCAPQTLTHAPHPRGWAHNDGPPDRLGASARRPSGPASPPSLPNSLTRPRSVGARNGGARTTTPGPTRLGRGALPEPSSIGPPAPAGPGTSRGSRARPPPPASLAAPTAPTPPPHYPRSTRPRLATSAGSARAAVPGNYRPRTPTVGICRAALPPPRQRPRWAAGGRQLGRRAAARLLLSAAGGGGEEGPGPRAASPGGGTADLPAALARSWAPRPRRAPPCAPRAPPCAPARPQRRRPARLRTWKSWKKAERRVSCRLRHREAQRARGTLPADHDSSGRRAAAPGPAARLRPQAASQRQRVSAAPGARGTMAAVGRGAQAPSSAGDRAALRLGCKVQSFNSSPGAPRPPPAPRGLGGGEVVTGAAPLAGRRVSGRGAGGGRV